MTSISSFNLFRNHCSGCGRTIESFATSRSGDLPIVFCDSVCRTTYENKQRLINKKNIVEINKPKSSKEISEKVSKVPWNNR